MDLFSPIVMVLSICILAILIYLHRTSELMNKRILMFFIAVILIADAGIFLFHNLKSRSETPKCRMAFFPLSVNDRMPENLSWLSVTFSDIIAMSLQRSVKNAIFSPFEWFFEIVDPDSVRSDGYLRSIAEKMRSSHYFHGSLDTKNGDIVLNYRVRAEGGSGFQDSVIVSPTDLAAARQYVAGRIMKYLRLSPQEIQSPEISRSVRALGLYSQAHHFYLQKEIDRALPQLSSALAEDPTFGLAHYLSAKCNFMLAVDAKAKKLIDEKSFFARMKSDLLNTLERDPLNGDAYRLLGEYYSYHERWSLAEMNIKTAHRLMPYNPKIFIALSRMHHSRYEELGYRDEEHLLNRGIFINPCDEENNLLLSDYYLFQNKREQAIKVLEEFLYINPESVLGLMALSKIYIVRNEKDRIVEILDKVIQLNPSNADAHYNLGIVHYNSNDYEKAKMYFNRAIDLDNHLNSYLYLAYISEAEGNEDQAIEYLRKRIHFKTGSDDEFAEEARRHLYELLNPEGKK